MSIWLDHLVFSLLFKKIIYSSLQKVGCLLLLMVWGVYQCIYFVLTASIITVVCSGGGGGRLGSAEVGTQGLGKSDLSHSGHCRPAVASVVV